MSARILVIDDEEALRTSVAKIVSRLGHSVDTAGTATEGLALLSRQPYELVLTDFRLPDLDGLEVIERARQLRPEAELVLFTGFGSIPLAVQAIKRGAYDFVTKPFKRADLERVVTRALEKQALAADNRRLRQQLDDRPDTPLGRIIGQSESIRAVLRVVEQVAPSTATVLIEGPSGTGKELVAEALHALSPRRDRPLVKVNCSAIPETLLESELSGHEKGAFTGALARKDGAFREDLYCRLNVIRIALPSLKDRADDIPLLLNHFLAFHAARNHRSLDGFDPEALRALRGYDWPGNVRELSHAVERAVALATGRLITRECLPEAVRLAAGPEPEPASGDRVIAVPVGTPLGGVERLVIAETLRHTGGNKAQAASLLGISARTIYRKQGPDTGEIE